MRSQATGANGGGRWGLRGLFARAGLLLALLLGFELAPAPFLLDGGARPAHAQFFFGWGGGGGDRYWDRPPPRPRRSVAPPRRQRDYEYPSFFGMPRYAPRREETRRRRDPGAGRADSRAPPPRRNEAEAAQQVLVFGDSMADWLAYGLEDASSESNELGVTRKHRAGSGLIRNDAREYDWVTQARDALAAEKANFVVMMIGLNDRHALRERVAARTDGDAARPNAAGPSRERMVSHEFRSEKWVELYSKRVDEVIAVLKTKRVPVIWVGLPPVRGPRSRADLNFINGIHRERAERAGIIYVDTWEGFLDDAGEYSNHGPDVLGQVRRLRSADGIHFTRAGARKLAHFVDREIKRLMSRDAGPVALPAPAAPEPPPPGPEPRPAAGPVIPLTGGAPAAETLLGAPATGPSAGDPVAAKVLVRGETPDPEPGRADQFTWPRPHTVADNDVIPPPALPAAAPARPATPRPAPPATRERPAPAAQAPPAQPNRARPSAAMPQTRGVR